MRISELVGKEIVNSIDGERLGVVDDREIVINVSTGTIESIILPNKGNILGSFRDKKHIVVPWQAVKTIGRDIIIVEMGNMAGNIMD